MRRFGHLHVPPHWRHEWSRHPEGMTILEALLNWINQVDEMTDDYNTVIDAVNKHKQDIDGLAKQIEDFIKDFSPELKDKVIEVLNEWEASGFLEAVITKAIGTKYTYPEWQTEYLNEFYRKVRTGENFKIICRGDSLTYGYDIMSTDRRPALTSLTDDGTAHTREMASISYPEALQKYLNVVYPSRATVVNQGYSGDTTETSYRHWFKDHGGDVVLIMLGTNDSSQNKGLENFLSYYRLIIERELEHGTAVILLTPPRRKAPAIKDDAYGNAVFQLGDEYGCPVVDMTELTSHMKADTFSDGTHFNGKGYEHIGARLTSLFIGEGVVNPTKVNGNKAVHGSRVAGSLELIEGVSFTNSTGYPTPDEYNDGYGVGLVFNAGGKMVFSFYTEEDDLLVYPSMYFPSAGANATFKLDFGVESQAVNNVYMYDQIYTNVERRVPNTVQYVKEQDFNWRLNTQDAFYINGVTSLEEKKIHIPKRGWHTILVEADALTLHQLDFIGYRDMRDMVNTNAIHYPKPEVIALQNGWTNYNPAQPLQVTVRAGIAYLDGWVTKTTIDDTIIGTLPVAPRLPSNFKVTAGLTSAISDVDPTLRIQQNGDILLVHSGLNLASDVITINITFAIS